MIRKLQEASKTIDIANELTNQQNSRVKQTVTYSNEVVEKVKEEGQQFSQIDNLLQNNKDKLNDLVMSINQLNGMIADVDRMLK